MGVDLLSHVVKSVSQIVIVEFMVNIERHCDGTAIRVQSIVQNRSVVSDRGGSDGSVKRQHYKLSCLSIKIRFDRRI